MPLSQPNSRGLRYAFMKKTENMCTRMANSIKLAAHECAERISQPKCITKVICLTDSYASTPGR